MESRSLKLKVALHLCHIVDKMVSPLWMNVALFSTGFDSIDFNVLLNLSTRPSHCG